MQIILNYIWNCKDKIYRIDRQFNLKIRKVQTLYYFEKRVVVLVLSNL